MNKNLKICIFTNHFYPEDFKVNDIAFELAKRNNHVTVITAVPDYPKKRIFRNKYTLFHNARESVHNVSVIRLPIVPRYTAGPIFLFLNYISYFISSYIFTFFHAFKNKYDVIFVHETSPFFIGLPAAHLKRRQNIPLIFWTLDLWPESLSAAGEIRNRLLLSPFLKMVRYVYDTCDKILIGSKGFRKSICDKGDYDYKCVYFPNWAEDVVPSENNIDLKKVFPFSQFKADDFVFLFAGNIGEAQNLDCVLKAALEIKKLKNIKFVFLGDGRRRSDLLETAARSGLQDTVFFPGRFPLSAMPLFMERADMLLVSLKDEYIFNLTVPSKVQFYMAQGKPILAMLNGDGADLITEAGCGIAVPANNHIAFRVAVLKFVAMKKNDLRTIGLNGKKYYMDNFAKEKRINQLQVLFEDLCQ